MNEKEIILEAMKKAGEPLNAGKVAELTGLDRKVVDKADAAAMRASLFAKRNRLWCNTMADTKTMRLDEVPRLDDQFCFPLYACAKEVVRQYRKPLEALNLTYTQYLVMMVLWEHGGMTEGQLGRKVYLDSGTLAPLLKRMERSGLINRIKPDGNVRKLYVTLTQEGRDLKEKAKSVPGEIQNCLPLPQEDLLVLRELLNHLLVSMEKNM